MCHHLLLILHRPFIASLLLFLCKYQWISICCNVQITGFHNRNLTYTSISTLQKPAKWVWDFKIARTSICTQLFFLCWIRSNDDLRFLPFFDDSSRRRDQLSEDLIRIHIRTHITSPSIVFQNFHVNLPGSHLLHLTALVQRKHFFPNVMALIKTDAYCIRL